MMAHRLANELPYTAGKASALSTAPPLTTVNIIKAKRGVDAQIQNCHIISARASVPQRCPKRMNRMPESRIAILFLLGHPCPQRCPKLNKRMPESRIAILFLLGHPLPQRCPKCMKRMPESRIAILFLLGHPSRNDAQSL